MCGRDHFSLIHTCGKRIDRVWTVKAIGTWSKEKKWQQKDRKYSVFASKLWSICDTTVEMLGHKDKSSVPNNINPL